MTKRYNDIRHGNLFHGTDVKSALDDADTLNVSDSADFWALKNLSISDLKSVLSAEYPGIPTAVTYRNYAAAAGEIVLCDTTYQGVGFTVSLPTTPRNMSTVTVFRIDEDPARTLTVKAEETDTFATGGNTVLVRRSEVVVFQFSAGVWRAISSFRRQERLTNPNPLDQLVSRMKVQPTSARLRIIDGLITDLQDCGVWDKLDALYLFAAHDVQAARLNWKSSVVRDAVSVNSPVFEVDRGFTGDGYSSYIDTNTNAVFQYVGVDYPLYVEYQATSATFGVYSRTGTSSAAIDASIVGGTALTTNSSDTFSARMNSNEGNRVLVSNDGRAVGLFAATRSGSTGYLYRDGVLKGSGTLGTAALPTTSANFLRGDLESLSARQLAAGFWGAALTETEHADLNIALSIYLSAIGAAV